MGWGLRIHVLVTLGDLLSPQHPWKRMLSHWSPECSVKSVLSPTPMGKEDKPAQTGTFGKVHVHK